MHYHRKPGWIIPEREAIPEAVFMQRRTFLAGSLGTVTGGLLGLCSSTGSAAAQTQGQQDPTYALYPAKRHAAFTLDRPLTEETVAAAYNNYYEFGPMKTVAWLAQRLKTRPWQVRVDGLVHKPHTFDIDDLIRSMPLEERLDVPRS
jgi:sulfoxide reductase catalytic subunit YedY